MCAEDLPEVEAGPAPVPVITTFRELDAHDSSQSAYIEVPPHLVRPLFRFIRRTTYPAEQLTFVHAIELAFIALETGKLELLEQAVKRMVEGLLHMEDAHRGG